MIVDRIAYVDLYCDDEAAAIHYFTARLGLTVTAVGRGPDRHSTLVENGHVRIAVTAPRGAGAVRDHLDRHGDGIADIAFASDDVADVVATAVRSGGRVLAEAGVPALSGFGCVRHTIVPAVNAHTARPPRIAWQSTFAGPARDAVPMRLDHVAVCLDAGTLQTTVDFYVRVFNLQRCSAEYIRVGDQAMDSVVVRSAGGGVTFTMIEPDPRLAPGQIDRFLDVNGGAGVQHLAFQVPDVVDAVHRLGARGVEFLSTPGGYYDGLASRVGLSPGQVADLRAVNVLADRDEWGYLLQIFTASPYPTGGLFYELIQRQEARGFGSANIRALYEAVERARTEALVGAESEA